MYLCLYLKTHKMKYLYLYLIGIFGCIWQIFFKYTFLFYTLIHNDNDNNKYILYMFIFHFHTIFVMTYYINISVIDTLIHVGRIKMLHKDTHPFVCSQHVVTGHWDWTVFDLQAQKYLNRLVSQMRAPLAACRELAGKLWQLCKVLYVYWT